VALSARGSRKTGDRVEKIEDAAVLEQVRRQALKVHLKSLVAALILTLLALAIPLG
jgi:hypothetical protein